MSERRSRPGAVWVAGLLVATGAGVATAHGLYQVAVAARVPAGIAWLYPLITDGLALVAYAATARLRDVRGRRYAWTIVVVAAGLSGIAQATWLAGGLTATAGAGAPAALRFGVGAWPAIAAAVCAHLLHLLTAAPFNLEHDRLNSGIEQLNGLDTAVQASFNPAAIEHPDGDAPASPNGGSATAERPSERPATGSRRDRHAGGAASATERARTAARAHAARHGQLPTVTELASLAEVSRGTAAAVLKKLRGERPGLQLVVSEPDSEPNS
jgi:hypothetical protein